MGLAFINKAILDYINAMAPAVPFTHKTCAGYKVIGEPSWWVVLPVRRAICTTRGIGPKPADDRRPQSTVELGLQLPGESSFQQLASCTLGYGTSKGLGPTIHQFLAGKGGKVVDFPFNFSLDGHGFTMLPV